MGKKSWKTTRYYHLDGITLTHCHLFRFWILPRRLSWALLNSRSRQRFVTLVKIGNLDTTNLFVSAIHPMCCSMMQRTSSTTRTVSMLLWDGHILYFMKRTRYGDNLSGFMTLLQPTSSSQSTDNVSESGPDSDSKDSQQGGSSKKQSDSESADDKVLSCIFDIFLLVIERPCQPRPCNNTESVEAWKAGTIWWRSASGCSGIFFYVKIFDLFNSSRPLTISPTMQQRSTLPSVLQIRLSELKAVALLSS